jgi:hypothetical protein
VDIVLLTEFLKWCCIINFGCLLYIALVLMLFPNFVYQVHSRFFKLSRKAFDVIIYSFIGVYKIVFIVFNLVPFVALKIVS